MEKYNAFEIAATMQTVDVVCDYEAPEVMQQYGNLSDWHHAGRNGTVYINGFC